MSPVAHAHNTKKSSNGAAPKPTPAPAKTGGLGRPKASAAAKPPTEKPSSATTAERKARLPPARKMGVKLASVSKRWAKLVNMTKGWSAETDVAMADVLEALPVAIAAFAKLPDGFTPPKKGGGESGAAQLQVGDMVDITEKAKKHYVDLLEPGEMVSLKIRVIAKGKVRVVTTDGTALALKRGHVKPHAAPAQSEAQDETAED